MALKFGTTTISNVNVGTGGDPTYNLTVTNCGNYARVYTGWSYNPTTGQGMPSSVDSDSTVACIYYAGSTGNISYSKTGISKVVLVEKDSRVGIYINNVYGEFASNGICKLKADTTIRLNGYASCLVEGTLITLADGTTKPIEKLTYADELMTWDFDNGCQSTARIAQLQRNQRTRHYNKLVLEDGTELYTVYNHSWFNITKNRFTRTMEATDIGDEIMTMNGPQKLVSKEELVDENHVWYYNLLTENNICCYANGILTGNHFCNLYPIVNMTYVKDNRELNEYEVFAPYCSEETFNAFRVAEYNYDNYDQEAIEAEFRYLSLWNFHVIPHDVDVYQYHNDYREVRELPRKDFNE